MEQSNRLSILDFRSIKVDICKRVIDLLGNNDVNRRDSNLLRIIANPLFNRLIGKSKDGIFHVLLDWNSHCILHICEPGLHILAHFDLSIEQEKFVICREHTQHISLLQFNQVLNYLVIIGLFAFWQGVVTVNIRLAYWVFIIAGVWDAIELWAFRRLNICLTKSLILLLHLFLVDFEHRIKLILLSEHINCWQRNASLGLSNRW